MWEISNYSQFTSFLISICAGIIYCLIYDIFRGYRLYKKVNNFVVFFQDIGYFVLITFATFLLLIAFSNGEIRAYIIFALLIGFIVCNFTISKITVKVFGFIFKKLNVMFDKIILLINAFFNKVEVVIAKSMQKSLKIVKNIEKIFKKHLK